MEYGYIGRINEEQIMVNQIEIGWASASITPDRPAYLHGQIYSRISSYVHDPITATAMAVTNGVEQAVFVSADMVCILDNLYNAVCKKVNGFEGLDGSKVIISATHTHNSINTEDMIFGENKKLIDPGILPRMEIPKDLIHDAEVLDFLVEKISSIIKDAWKSRKPGAVSAAADYAAIGFNRRPQFGSPDGSVESIMYGACSQDDFVRFEGTVDHAINMLYAWDMERNLTGVIVNVPCPSQVFELHSFISADYWSYTRTAIRGKLGNIFILPICGAAGDQNPLDLVRISKYNEKELKEWNAQAGAVFRNFDMAEESMDIGSRITEAVNRGRSKAEKNIQSRPVFRHKQKSIEVPIRKVSEADYRDAKKEIKKILAEFSLQRPMEGKDLVRVFEPIGIINRWEQQQKSEIVQVRSNILRIGDAAFCTNPFELFVEYSLRIRARTKPLNVFICQLTNGSLGYLPTDTAIAGGSYSSKPASTLVGPRGGDLLTEAFIKEINDFWK
jgi:hypothetical protein